MSETWHRLLKRQIKKFFGGEEKIPPSILPFIGDINESYIEADRERRLLERIQDNNAIEINRFKEKQRELSLLEARLSMFDSFARFVPRQFLQFLGKAVPVESSTEIIFSLDSDGRVLTINDASRSLLGKRASEVLGVRLEELIYRPEEVRQKLMRDRIIKVMESKKRLVFAETFVYHNEPRDLHVSLECIDSDEGKMIFGRAWSLADNALVLAVRDEVRRFMIGNYVRVAEQLTIAITANLTRYCDDDVASSLRTGVRELMINAIEHGNLNITFDEKTRTTADSTFQNLVTDRQNDPRYANRKVHVYYSLSPQRVVFRIRDDGDGFDHKHQRASGPAAITLFHGRGIAIAESFYHSVRYNAKGNEVILTYNFRESV